MPRLVLVVATLGLTACGSRSPAPVANTPPSTGAATLGAALTREVGAGLPVAIVPGTAGLRAISADGARTRTLVPGPVPWALVDNDAGVVWFGSADGTAIDLVDLEGPAAAMPPVETIATGLPTQTDGGGPMFAVGYESPPTTPAPSPADPDDVPDLGPSASLSFGHPITPHIGVVVGPKPRLFVEGGILDLWDQTEELRATVAAAKLPGRDRLIALGQRVDARPVTPAAPAPPDQRVDTIDKSNCEDEDRCGTAEPVPNTTLWRVAVAFSCGDGCYTEWRLYDPARKAFLEPDWASQLVSASVAPDGSGFVADGAIIRFDTGPLAVAPGGEAGGGGGGWLGGGAWVGL